MGQASQCDFPGEQLGCLDTEQPVFSSAMGQLYNPGACLGQLGSGKRKIAPVLCVGLYPPKAFLYPFLAG